jgi:hypothetical protein
MFLWVELVIGHFQYLLTDEEVLRAVYSLPASLQDALVVPIKFMAVAHPQ